MKCGKIFIIIMLIATWDRRYAVGQRTALDNILAAVYRPLRLLGLQAFSRTSHNNVNIKALKDSKKMQNLTATDIKKFCDAKNGPGRRSSEKPTSVHRLRPGDIDIVGGIGDSITAGNGAFAIQPFQVTIENRGVSFSIGGMANWKKYLTLPNILKEFNPNLYGYSTDDGISSDRHSKFNVAEFGSMSRDLPHMAKVLYKRMKNDKHVQMDTDWKLITILSGANDLCIDVCFDQIKPNKILENHEKDLLKTFRFLRDNIPRLVLYVVTAPKLIFVRKFVDLPEMCNYTLPFECPCIAGLTKTKEYIDQFIDLNNKWIDKDIEISNLPEFNRQNFTIITSKMTVFEEFLKTKNGKMYYNFLSYDCFHLSQMGHAISANALWNNLFEFPEEKSVLDPELFRVFRCPSEKYPYILTRENMKEGFIN